MKTTESQDAPNYDMMFDDLFIIYKEQKEINIEIAKQINEFVGGLVRLPVLPKYEPASIPVSMAELVFGVNANRFMKDVGFSSKYQQTGMVVADTWEWWDYIEPFFEENPVDECDLEHMFTGEKPFFTKSATNQILKVGFDPDEFSPHSVVYMLAYKAFLLEFYISDDIKRDYYNILHEVARKGKSSVRFDEGVDIHVLEWLALSGFTIVFDDFTRKHGVTVHFYTED